MAAQFCMKCGSPLPPGAAFCLKCGAPVPGVTPGAPGLATSLPPPPPPPPPGMGLAEALGVAGGRTFLLQHQFLSGGHSYRVMSLEKRPLFTARENYAQESRSAGLVGSILGSQGIGMGAAFGSRTFAWTVLDAGNTPRAAITLQIAEYQAQSTLTDPSGTPILSIVVNRGLMGKLTATAVTPDGRPLFKVERHLSHREFPILDGQGRSVAKIHEAFASVRDTYRVDLEAPIDPVAALIFAILIDREKERGH